MEEQTVQTSEQKISPLEKLAPDNQQPTEEQKTDSGNGHDKDKEVYSKQVKKRIDELTWKYHEEQRKSESYMKDMDGRYKTVLELNKAMREELDALQDKVEVRPDPMEDPDGYEKYLERKTERHLKRQNRKIEYEQSTTPKTDDPQSPEMIFNIQKEAVMGICDDYGDVMEVVAKELRADPTLEGMLAKNKNIPLAAYKYGKKLMKEREGARTQGINQGYVEGSTPPANAGAKEFTAMDEKICRDLGISKEKYMKYKGTKRR